MAHTMTPKRRAALRKAQLASARKRRGKGKGKLAAANRTISKQKRRVAVVAATGGLALAAAGVAGAMYARKTAGGGPKAPKHNYSHNSPANVQRRRQLKMKRNAVNSLNKQQNHILSSTKRTRSALANKNHVWQL